MTSKREKPTEPEIDDDAVKRYFEGTGGSQAAAAMSMMTHEHNLPSAAVDYRLSKEIATIQSWLEAVGYSGRVLDVGCGAGAWVEIFANRFQSVVGVERSGPMVAAAQERIAHLQNARVYQGDGREDLPDGPFDLIFLGGLMMYLKDSDVLEMLHSLKERLSEAGTIVLRESTVRKGMFTPTGEYQVIYRSISAYEKLFLEAGIADVQVRGNSGYTSMVIAEEMVDLRRKLLPFLPKQSLKLGALTWAVLRGTSPISFRALPWTRSLLRIPWPKLQNHFFRLSSRT